MNRFDKSLIVLLFFAANFLAAQTPQPRSHQNFDRDWKFAFGHARNPEKDFNYGVETVLAKSGGAANTAIEPRFKDSLWRSLNLPHDWAVELPFVNDPAFNVMAHGYKPIGGNYPETSIGWYRKHFSVEKSEEGKRFQIQFDGVFRDAEFWINGFYLGNNKSGYIGVAYDITDFLRYGADNVLVVRADATQYEGWFYEGAGIYRHVWLNTFEDTHIANDGIFAHAKMEGSYATLTVETELVNDGNAATDLTTEIILSGREGGFVAKSKLQTLHLEINQSGVSRHVLKLYNPILWDLDNPYLHRIQVLVKKSGKLVDQQTLKFGFRSVEIKPDGMLLNGKKLKILGVNCHQDHAGVGSALPDYLQYYRIDLLKNLGVNAYRTSHNPPTPELLDACDSLGMLVMDETRLLNSGAEYMDQFVRMLKRDRSRTSVFMWSIGNEEGWIHTTPTGKRIAETFLKKQAELDPTRTSTYAADVANVFNGVNEVIPVRSFNYRQFAVADYHRDHPTQPIIGTEMGSTVTTRGQYEKDTIRAYVPDQDITAPWWASTAETWWTLAAENDFWLGGFVWTGLDYRGEPTPYIWPNINSHFGIMDVCGFPKNIYYYYQSWWTDKDILHISPHWNWQEKRGEPIDVWVNSNADEVELFLNEKTLGKKVMPRNSHLKWTVNFEPGKLEAIGYKKGNVLKAKMESTGVPTEIALTPYKTTMLADGQDVTVVNVSVFDNEGREVPNASNMIQFFIEGDAKIIGVGNGDPSSHEPDKCVDGAWQRSLFNGKCQVIIQSGLTTGKIHFEARSPNLWKGDTDIITVAPGSVTSVTIDPKYVLKGAAARPQPVDKMMGADISFLPELEAKGIKFKENGVEVDAIHSLKSHGFNYVRLRIFNDPAAEKGYSPKLGFCDLEHTKAMAKRVKAAGMKLLLDFHYSDYWADPGKQYKPKAWEGLGFEALKKALYDYTFEVISQLKAQGTPPDMVQIGNEINHGIVWPEGSVAHLDSLAQLLCAGTAAVKAVAPETVMMLHVALGGQNDESVFFIENMLKRGVHFDVIGESYYPKWHGTLDDLRDNLSDLVRRFGKDVIVVEYSARKEEVHKIAFNLPGGHGKGTCIWEPLSTWESVFDWQGNAKELLKLYDGFRKQYLDK
ncbi:MAG: glycosyl hydrolase 53 family protein [Lewinellaceae bacterium]|nr:glycosyl hydrolase 53 family protein [Lewinellaceae bacterium]